MTNNIKYYISIFIFNIIPWLLILIIPFKGDVTARLLSIALIEVTSIIMIIIVNIMIIKKIEVKIYNNTIKLLLCLNIPFLIFLSMGQVSPINILINLIYDFDQGAEILSYVFYIVSFPLHSMILWLFLSKKIKRLAN